MALLLHLWLSMVYQPFSNCCPLCLSFGVIFLWGYYLYTSFFHEANRLFFFCRYWFLPLALINVCTRTQTREKWDFIQTILYNILLIFIVLSFSFF